MEADYFTITGFELDGLLLKLSVESVTVSKASAVCKEKRMLFKHSQAGCCLFHFGLKTTKKVRSEVSDFCQGSGRACRMSFPEAR